MLTGQRRTGHSCAVTAAAGESLSRRIPAMIGTMPDMKTAELQAPLVHSPRHPADELTGCRLHATESDEASVHLPLPHDVAPSLSHVAVAIDTAAGEAAAAHLPNRGSAIRTLSLNAQLTASLTAGSWLQVYGRVRAVRGRSIVASTEVFDAAGDLVALGMCRFVVIDQPRSTGPAGSTSALDRSAVPSSWDAALGLGDALPGSSADSGNPTTVRSAAPQASTDNAASMVHGGVLVRALELGMHSALGRADADPQAVLSDVAVVYHRPVPLGAGNGVQAPSSLRRTGRTVSVAAAALVGPDQKLLTTAEGIFGSFDM